MAFARVVAENDLIAVSDEIRNALKWDSPGYHMGGEAPEYVIRNAGAKVESDMIRILEVLGVNPPF